MTDDELIAILYIYFSTFPIFQGFANSCLSNMYPFAYCHDTIKPYIDTAFFIDIPLDISLARRILRDMRDATADEIRRDLEIYLKYARIAYIQMQKDILPLSDYVINGTMSVDEIVNEIVTKIYYGK